MCGTTGEDRERPYSGVIKVAGFSRKKMLGYRDDDIRLWQASQARFAGVEVP